MKAIAMTSRVASCRGAIAARVVIAVSVICAAVQAEAAPQNPDKRLDVYLQENLKEVQRLQAIALNFDAMGPDRISALNDLAFISEEAGVKLAADLADDKSQEVALAAIELLANSLVMAGHATVQPSDHTSDHGNPWSQYVRGQHQLAIDALRAAIDDPREAIKNAARLTLVRGSDDKAIASVQQDAKVGKLGQEAAVQICAQAISTLGRACLVDFLNEGSIEGKIAATKILGATETDQPVVRDKIFLNSNADERLRSAAAETLARYDKSFPTYGLIVTLDPTTPPDLFAASLRAYATRAAEDGTLDGAQWNAIKRALDHKIQDAEQRIDSSPGLKKFDSLYHLQKSFNAGRPQ
ncbi:hypothetical protein GGE68_002058 [Rhizobium leguminosarum]|uniref:hypothetical protein n=1 Tax=Rhizobium leguminosarum TaxID=384 RepID=UPI0016204871|nr:hypothetical protein [Rhizobium leguminosarum]MBB5663868.1 hypothetical protein [Rhizobium leguminosarum]